MRRRRGGAAVEFALSLPVLIVAFVGVVELSRYISLFHMVARAARDGARVGSITIEGPAPTGAQIEDAAQAQAEEVLDFMGYTCTGGCVVTATWHPVDGIEYVTVHVRYPYQPFTSMFPTVNQVEGRFTMMTQQQ